MVIHRSISILALVLLMALWSTADVYGQRRPKKRRGQGLNLSKSLYPGNVKSGGTWAFLGGIGWASYFGELCETGDCFQSPRPQLGFGVKYRANTYLSFRSLFHYYRIVGSDAEFGDESRIPRNLSFYSNNFEVTGTVIVDFIPISKYYEVYANRRDFGVFGFIGGGFSYFNPQADYQGESISLRELETEGVSYGPVTWVMPIGIGVRYKIGRFSDITAEIGHRFTGTDRLDDVSSEDYKDPESFEDAQARELAFRGDELGYQYRENYIRGNPDANDGYYILSIKYEWTLDHHDPVMKRKMNFRKKKRRRSRKPKW